MNNLLKNKNNYPSIVWKMVSLFAILIFVFGFIMSYYFSYNYSQFNWITTQYDYTNNGVPQNIQAVYNGRDSSEFQAFIYLLISFIGVMLFFISFYMDNFKFPQKISDSNKDIRAVIKKWDYILLFVISLFTILMMSLGIYFSLQHPTITFQMDFGSNATVIKNFQTITQNQGPLWILVVGINFALIILGAMSLTIFILLSKKFKKS